MGLSDLLKRFTGRDATGEEQLHAIMDWIDSQGGIAGIIEKFHKGGLDGLVASWTGQGKNLPVTVHQIIAVFGEPTLQALADRTGIDLHEASSLVAKLLPKIVDNFSPEEEVQTKTDLLSTGMNLLKSKLLG